MENLLSLAFDNLSSYDGPKVRKGLRQVEGLLAQICLSCKGNSPNTSDHDMTEHDNGDSNQSPPRKDLGRLSEDPAFREFFKLQEGFEWNIGLRLISTLDRLMAKGSDGQNDLVILSALDLIQGALLLHPPSKGLFQREQNMNVSYLFNCTAQEDTKRNQKASPRPPRTFQLPCHPVRHAPHPRRRPHRRPQEHARL
ncbi:hypothetical protein NQ176_g10844 [Zarea fungicola]|uniref:Uncharacterized protein n=1 Tax=Zarea fungicola TaxID=93591 RepID=A0ACC1ME65_9HYPO|nr:hypothetical protein NQ176_g10844 [Lecanicillium fungicola]